MPAQNLENQSKQIIRDSQVIKRAVNTSMTTNKAVPSKQGTSNWFIEKMTDEYQYATDDAYTVGIEKGVNDEYCDVLQPLGIESKVCFRKYYTSVDNMLLLYEKYGSPQKSIRAVITAAIDEEILVSDIFENYYEYKDDDTFNSRFNYESEKLLDEFYENLVDEEDGVFDDIQF